MQQQQQDGSHGVIPVRVLVTGSRGWNNVWLISEVVDDIDEAFGREVKPTLVSGGCATGADYLTERIVERMGWGIERHPADWTRLSRRAGFVRNEEMVASMPRFCIAFWDGKSRGTRMTIDLCRRYGVGLYVYRSNDDRPLMPSGRRAGEEKF